MSEAESPVLQLLHRSSASLLCLLSSPAPSPQVCPLPYLCPIACVLGSDSSSCFTPVSHVQGTHTKHLTTAILFSLCGPQFDCLWSVCSVVSVMTCLACRLVHVKFLCRGLLVSTRETVSDAHLPGSAWVQPSPGFKCEAVSSCSAKTRGHGSKAQRPMGRLKGQCF